MRFRSLALSFALCGVPALASAQDLTLERALDLARENNGTVRAALLQYEASKSDARSAFAAYYPTVTPAFSYETSRLDTYTGPGTGLFNDVASTSSVTASWLLLDSGFRDATYRRSAFGRETAELSALQTLRQTLFDVHNSFYLALRSDELLRVRQTQLARALEIEKQAKEFAETGAGPEKDVLQARADALNAKAAELTARNAVSTSRASLKAVLGLPITDELSNLVAPEAQPVEGADYTLEDALAEGLKNRPDLAAQRLRVESQRQSVRLARIDQGFTWTLDARHVHSFSPDAFDRSALVFQVSIPLYDGARSRENLRSSEYGLEAQKATLTQSERDAMAEIESAYKEFAQNRERLGASQVALEAAKLNYKAAFDSRAEGAGELIEVLTAQVSLTTAESSYIEAYYDTLISNVRLMLATGRAIPGEDQ